MEQSKKKKKQPAESKGSRLGEIIPWNLITIHDSTKFAVLLFVSKGRSKGYGNYLENPRV